MQSPEVFFIVPDVIFRLINLRSQHQEHSIAGIMVLLGPNHRGHVQPKGWVVYQDIFGMAAIIDHYFTAPLEAEHKLFTHNMGVISSVFGAWYRINHKITLRNERQAATQFSNGQVTPRVRIVGPVSYTHLTLPTIYSV